MERESGVPGGGSDVQTPPPRNSEGPPKNRAKLNAVVKTVLKKLLNLGRQHTKMFGKKGSKILKLSRPVIVLHWQWQINWLSSYSLKVEKN